MSDHEKEVIAQAKQQLQAPLASSRFEAALTLAQHGDFSGRHTLLSGLGDEDWGARARAATYLGRIGTSSAIAPLSEMLKTDPMSDNHNAAIIALQEIGRPAVVPPLIDALSHKEADRREDARTALHRLLGEQVLPSLANEDELINETGEVEEDPEEEERVRNWWRRVAPKFESDLSYSYGLPASPAVWIARLKEVQPYPVDWLLMQLENWTGQNFGSEPISEVIARWEDWWEKNSDAYEPGRKYFYGHLVE